MKKSQIIALTALLAFGMLACGEKKITKEDLLKSQAELFNEDRTLNEAVAPKVAEKYCRFVEENPEDSTAAMWLYHALEINVFLKDVDKTVELSNKLLSQYPQSKYAPMSLFLMGSYVYNDLVNDTAQAHVMFQRIIEDYPQSELVDDAEKSIEYLGLTPEEIFSLMMMEQMEEEEGEW